jgi:cytochrome oxidase Cu insertion factor (SCO1/SenC/PrrC family)
MKRVLIIGSLIIVLSLWSLSCQRAAQPNGNLAGANAANSSNTTKASADGQPPAAPQTHLKIGDQAPDFTLNDTEGRPVKLSDFRGKKNVVLAFYVMAFTGG